MYVVEMAFVVILMSFSMPRMTWHTIRDDTAEHGMYVVEMAFVVILMSFSEVPRMTWRTIRDDTAEHGMYVVEMAFAVILMSFSGGDDISIHFNEFFSGPG